MSATESTEAVDPQDQAEASTHPAQVTASAVRPTEGSLPVQAGAPTSGASLGKNVILFLGIMTTLALGYSYLGKEVPVAGPGPVRWNVGQTVDVEVTLVAADARNLACGSSTAIAGRHCEFEGPGKVWSQGSSSDDSTLLRPYTTTNRTQFLASGLWSQPTLAADKLPPTRFTVKCKYAVEGKVAAPQVRWDETGSWNAQSGDWYAGRLSACTVTP